ncbi:hypothetical protein BD408DRAFT_402953 [Parasitella parasitica]|nr:hypothetical protein BD408DRAFT_402953 [Parasitella parasitica]
MSDKKWEEYNEEIEDEDLIMEEGDVDDEDEDEGTNAVYPESFSKASGSSNSSNVASPRFGMTSQGDFSCFDMNAGASPIHGWNDAIDEKGESVALLMHLEKTVVHQNFFNSKY